MRAAAGHAAARTQFIARATAPTGLRKVDLLTLNLSHISGRADRLTDLVRLNTDRTGLDAELTAQTDRFMDAKARKLDLIEPAARLENLQRYFWMAKAAFASAMARSRIKNDLCVSRPFVQVFEDASLPDTPSSPKRKLVVAAGGAATLIWLLGLLLAGVRRPLILMLIAVGCAPLEDPIMVSSE